MAQTEFYPLDIDYDENAVVKILGVTRDNKKVCIYDDSVQPYFWAFNHDIEEYKDKILKIRDEEQDVYVTKTEMLNRQAYLDKGSYKRPLYRVCLLP